MALAENQSALFQAELTDELAHIVEKRATIFQLRAQIHRDNGDLADAVADNEEWSRLQQQVASLRSTDPS